MRAEKTLAGEERREAKRQQPAKLNRRAIRLPPEKAGSCPALRGKDADWHLVELDVRAAALAGRIHRVQGLVPALERLFCSSPSCCCAAPDLPAAHRRRVDPARAERANETLQGGRSSSSPAPDESRELQNGFRESVRR
jgi:hypothetical protein